MSLLPPPRERTPHTLFLIPCGVSPMGGSPTSSPPTGCSSSRTHKQTSQTSQTAPEWVLHRVTSSAPLWAPLSTGPLVPSGSCSSVGFLQGHTSPIQHNENLSPHRSYCWLVIRIPRPSVNCQELNFNFLLSHLLIFSFWTKRGESQFWSAKSPILKSYVLFVERLL